MSAVTLHRIDAGRRMNRFYRLDVQGDLFGAFCFICEWGRIGKSGQTRQTPFVTADEAYAALERQQRAKERRGYARMLRAGEGS